MPKMKTHKGTAKRVKVTGTGKLVSEQTGKRHLMERKSTRITRRQSGTIELSKADTSRVNKLLGR